MLTDAGIKTNSSVRTSEHHTVHHCKVWGSFCKQVFNLVQFKGPRFILEGETDPEYPNKQPGNPPPIHVVLKILKGKDHKKKWKSFPLFSKFH